MKRWQDRGEVLDSDDEDPGESQSEERPFKPARPAEDAQSPDGPGYEALGSLEVSVEQRGVQDAKTGHGENETLQNGSTVGTQNVTTLWTEESAGQALEEAAEYDESEAEDRDKPSHPSLRKCLPGLGYNNVSEAMSPQSEQSETLPDIGEVLAGNYIQEHQNGSAQSPGSSSALSEREVSPSPPLAIFRFSSPRLDSAEVVIPIQDEEGDALAPPFSGAIPEEAIAGATGRRGLRARNEKQLHPYLFEKAQHQKLFRERGYQPIRWNPGQRKEAETQDAALSGDEDDSGRSLIEEDRRPNQPSSDVEDVSASHEAMRNAGLDTQPNAVDSDEELPELSDLFRHRRADVAHLGMKRRKLFHPARRTTTIDPNAESAQTQDDFSIPPSPPPTSSDSANHAILPRRLDNFRIPRGVTPDLLPTPQISSELGNAAPKPRNRNESEPETEPESPPRRSRPSTIYRTRPQPIAIDSSTGASEAEPEANRVDRRLQRERKRIKGVLPASWVKIDFRAQQKQTSPSPRRARRSSSPSPMRTAPQKGIAQRILTNPSTFAERQNAITVSDEESGEGQSLLSPSAPEMRQPKLHFERPRATTAPSEFVNEEQMEVDWIDPMFAGTSRPRSEQRRHKKRQPRITESFDNQGQHGINFSEERRAFRIPKRTAATGSKPKTKRSERRALRKPAAPRLSIVDVAQNESRTALQGSPQFVRIATRRARMQPDRGRHSPTGKHIRLATRDDTEDAMSVLRSWRGGILTPKHDGNVTSNHGDVEMAERYSSDDGDVEHIRTNRTPLAEIQHNRQQRLPGLLRKQETRRNGNSRASYTVHEPGMRQTQLRPITMPGNEQPDEDVINDQHTSTTRADRRQDQRRRPPLVQTPHIRYRGAQLESLESELSRDHRAAVFERRMHRLTENIARPQHDIGKGFQLARFLSDVAPTTENSERSDREQNEFDKGRSHATSEAATKETTLPRRPRKRLPHRLDAEAREYRQPSEPSVVQVDSEKSEQDSVTSAGAVLRGLGPFGTRYATDFDVLPLQLGTYFHSSSFIGSGDFAASLDFASRNLDNPLGRIQVHVSGDVLEWGAWTEDVAVGLSRVPRAVSDALESICTTDDTQPNHEQITLILANVDYLLRSTVRYFTSCLAFLDPVDRRQCIHAMHRLIEDLLESVAEHQAQKNMVGGILARCLQYIIVLARQQIGLCDHAFVEAEVRIRSRELMSTAAGRLATHILPGCLEDLRGFYEQNRHATKREIGIRDTDSAICGVVVLYHVTQGLDGIQSLFWTTVYRALNVESSIINTVQGLDQAWYDIFSILPALEIDKIGIFRPGSRWQGMTEDWNLPKCLVERLFDLYASTSLTQGSTINDYVRATLTRCSHLISRWGWCRCESLLGTVFDFFARRGLAQLHNEDNHGSPRFLDELHQQAALEVQSEDRFFHIFLKMLASGLKGMQKNGVYPDKKIGGIAWRFIPNHGRTHRKDAELQQRDLDSLRNHHDLLCTLYYAAPPGHRLRVNLVQNLVDHSVSHREACRLNIRTWAILASFQVSIDEGGERLEEFCTWYRDMTTITIDQYRLARSEVEHEMASARAQGHQEPSSSVVEEVIARNQRQIAGTLVDIVAALQRALQSSCNATNAICLLKGSAFWQVYELFDPSARRLYGVLREALHAAGTALDVQRKFARDIDSQQASDDSQDYGDSAALQQLACTQIQPPKQDVVDILHAPLAHLVSNVLGADTIADDALLTNIVDIWVRLAQVAVRSGCRSWSSYISDYSPDAWSQLRDTEQRRKYTPYFLSRVVELGDVELTEASILTSWLQCLVEREARLKFQHCLTSALLNRHPHEQLLTNLPFSRHTQGRYEVSLQDLRQRRLATISSVCSNMRDIFDTTLRERPREVQEVRQTYGNMLRQLMQTMKNNYHELQASRSKDVADVQAEGTYVGFVQQVVSFLQQYTTDICAVDRFFTDSTAFPLPATDRTYVVGRLKSYIPKLRESRKRSELAVFVQTVSERAAVDGEQAYLVDQLVSATVGTLERGNSRTPSLRQVLCTAIFPAYIENALSTACSWIVAMPILEACSRIADDLLYSTKVEDIESVSSVHDTIGMLLHAASHITQAAVKHPGRMTLPHVRATLSAVFKFAKSCLTCVHYLERTERTEVRLMSAVAYFYECTAYLEAYLNDIHEIVNMSNPPMDIDFSSSWPDTLDSVRKQIHTKFTNEWYAHNGQYYVRRGNHTVEVVVNLGDDVRLHLLTALRAFRESFKIIFHGQSRMQHMTADVYSVGSVMV